MTQTVTALYDTYQAVRKRDPIGGDGALLTALSACNQPVERSCVRKAVRVERRIRLGPGFKQAAVRRPYRAASIFGIPTRFTARVRLYASAVRLNSARTFSRPRIRK
jgi:hypothetical protein